jgi:hypothetical protein
MDANKRYFRASCGIGYECIPQEGSSTECGDCGQPLGKTTGVGGARRGYDVASRK